MTQLKTSYPKKENDNIDINDLKNKLLIYDKSLSEWQNMQINKYDRIWDCGNLKYELDF